MSDTEAVLTHPRREPHEGPLRVLVGKERFSENHAWSEMPQHWPFGLAGRAMIEVAGQGQLEARLVDGGPSVDVVVPMCLVAVAHHRHPRPQAAVVPQVGGSALGTTPTARALVTRRDQ